MRDEMILNVRYINSFREATASIYVEPIYKQAFAPMCTTEEPLMSVFSDDVMIHSSTHKMILELREDAANDLSKALVGMILASMQINDKHNGYTKNET